MLACGARPVPCSLRLALAADAWDESAGARRARFTRPEASQGVAKAAVAEEDIPMKILVLGGGQQGRVIAVDLAYKLPTAHVDVADLRQPILPSAGNLRWIEADLGDPEWLVRRMREYDLTVGALPSRLGFSVMRAAIEARRPLVDVSFCAGGRALARSPRPSARAWRSSPTGGWPPGSRTCARATRPPTACPTRSRCTWAVSPPTARGPTATW
jgi:hypothetical protein